MIGHFPTPYHDELLYSICARFSDRVRYPAVASVNIEIFGSRHFIPAVDLPSHIDALTSRLPPGCGLTSDRIIDENTLLPFYSPFLPLERVDRIRAVMKSTDGTAIDKISGVTPSLIRPPERLQFCPACVVEDRRKLGETYWHRLHQLPGIKICPDHNSMLETSNIPARTIKEYIPAEHAIINTPPQLIDVNDLPLRLLLRISQDADWLLKQRGLVPGFADLRERYVHLLMEKGLASFNRGHVAGPKLLEALQEFYSISVLNSLNCGSDRQQFNKWPLVFVKDLNINKVHHPLRHLLIIQLLGHKPESFFSFTKPEYFGKGPWPCANPVCDFYLKPSINRCQIKRVNSRSRGKLVGVFECACGYTYTREETGSDDANSFTVRSVTRFGPIWEAALRQLWKDRTVSLQEIARRLLGTKGTKKLQMEAARIGLPFPRKGLHESSRVTSRCVLGTRPKVRSGRTISESRKEWKVILAKNPQAIRTHLRTNYRPLYRWLADNDTEWLKKHLPPQHCLQTGALLIGQSAI